MDKPTGTAGFSLLELLIAVTVAGLLSLVAVPAYLSQVEKVRRSDAIASLLRLQLLQAEWLAGHREPASLAELGWRQGRRNSLEGHYTITLEPGEGRGYRIVARPEGLQADDDCGSFAVDQDGATYNGYAGPRCWAR